MDSRGEVMKIGIITILTGSNFGNRLQNYAVQKIYSDYSSEIECETIVNATGNRFEKKLFIYKLIRWGIRYVILPIYDIFGKYIVKNPRIKKRMAFERFNKEHISWSKDCISKDCINKKFEKEYDFFSTGSDQVWNYTCYFNSDIEYLTFTSSEKKIALAASFGVTSFNEERKREIQKKLKDFKAISVRENAAKEFLGEMDIEASTVIDPTMVVPIEHWKKCEKKVFEIPEKYILVYVLQRDKKGIKEHIEKISKENKLPIIDVYDSNTPEHYAYDPFEFLWLVEHARLVCTDSFHASVFSIMLSTPFVVFGRSGMNSRITTLLEKFDLQERMFDKINYSELFNINLENRDKVLEEEKKKVYEFLDNALN